MSDFLYILRERWGSIVTERDEEKCQRVAEAKVTFVTSNKYVEHNASINQQWRSMKSIAAKYVIARVHRICNGFSACSSVVYIKYTLSSQTKNHSALCVPAVNIYC